MHFKIAPISRKLDTLDLIGTGCQGLEAVGKKVVDTAWPDHKSFPRAVPVGKHDEIAALDLGDTAEHPIDKLSRGPWFLHGFRTEWGILPKIVVLIEPGFARNPGEGRTGQGQTSEKDV